MVDDHAMVRRGLRAYLAELGDVAVVGEAEDGQAALDTVERLAEAGTLPTVLLMDLVMPGMDGIAATTRIHRRHPEMAIVALTSFVDDRLVHATLCAGATGFVMKDAQPNAIASAIRAAARGEVHLDPAAAQRLATAMVVPDDAGHPALTKRELEVLALVAAGHSNQDIADRLVLSERTVRSHVKQHPDQARPDLPHPGRVVGDGQWGGKRARAEAAGIRPPELAVAVMPSTEGATRDRHCLQGFSRCPMAAPSAS